VARPTHPTTHTPAFEETIVFHIIIFERITHKHKPYSLSTTMSRRKQERVVIMSDDADVAAGGVGGIKLSVMLPPPPAPISKGGMSTITSSSDIEFYEDLISDPVLVLGVDITHLPRNTQFLICASGVFFFSLLYGYLQELLSVELCSRQLGLYLAMVQFVGYTFLAFLLNNYVYEKQNRKNTSSTPKMANTKQSSNSPVSMSLNPRQLVVPFSLYLGLSLLRAVDLAMTNLAMQYINYPAKTLMKSSRVVFTMIFGVFITHKRYKLMDYVIVIFMVLGLAVFMHADATSSAVFQPLGVIMLVCCRSEGDDAIIFIRTSHSHAYVAVSPRQYLCYATVPSPTCQRTS
jgi:hypothetical protein